MEIPNIEIARIFLEVADLLELRSANPFRVRAYRNAARVIEQYPEPIADIAAQGIDALDALPGVGHDLAEKIEQIVESGTLPMLGELEKETPRATAEILHIPGIGPKRATQIVEELGVHSIDELAEAARAGRVAALSGFGAKTERKILHEIERGSDQRDRVMRAVAAQYGEPIIERLREFDEVGQADIAGSYRRRRDTVGDLDILVTCRHCPDVVERFVGFPEIDEVIARGSTRASVRLRSGLQIDLRAVEEKSYGAALFYFTGSKSHNIAVRRIAQQKGLKVNEYGVFRGEKSIAGRTEKDVYKAVGLPWIPPELREDRGEIDAARRGALPTLIELDDIRGDLQCHTTSSDGKNSLEEMARAAEERGYEYLAVTDHTKVMRITGGMDRAGFRRQMKAIDALNGTLKHLRVLKGAEVDILPDGSLDLDDDTLAELDIVLVALHLKLDLGPKEQTRRVLRAISHPQVNVFAHPTGRRIGTREGARFDFDAVMTAARDNGVLLEIDAQPERLDLDDVAARTAIEHGLELTISTDAHTAASLDLMQWGVDQARRGWVEKKNVLNTRPLKQVLERLAK